MERDNKLTVVEAIEFIEETTGEHVEDLGLTDDQIFHMIQEGF